MHKAGIGNIDFIFLTEAEAGHFVEILTAVRQRCEKTMTAFGPRGIFPAFYRILSTFYIAFSAGRESPSILHIPKERGRLLLLEMAAGRTDDMEQRASCAADGQHVVHRMECLISGVVVKNRIAIDRDHAPEGISPLRPSKFVEPLPVHSFLLQCGGSREGRGNAVTHLGRHRRAKIHVQYSPYHLTGAWIDHCTFVDSQDGALDSKVCDWATYTYNHFYYTDRSYSHAYTCGCGWVSPDGAMVLHLTFANNIWGEGCMRRLPQADNCFIHLVNNYHNCPGNSVGMTINKYSRALVEGNYAAAGVNKPLDGSGANRNVTAKDNSFANSQAGSVVTVPYSYTKIAAADVPATLTGVKGAGATLGNDATDILSTIPTVARGETGNFGDISITVSGKDYGEGHVTGDFTGIKFSRNTDYTINLPQDVTITSVEVTGYTNVDTGDLAYVSKLGANEFNTENGTFPLRTDKTTESHTYTLATPATGSMAIRFGNNQATATIKLIGGTTGIHAIGSDAKKDNNFYTLQGVRVDKPTKGIYIQNGKKIIIK